MIKKEIFFILIFFISSSFSPVYANNIAYIDLDNLLQNTNLGKKIFYKLDSQKKDHLNKIIDKEKQIKNIENDLNTKKNILSENEIKFEINNLKKEINDFKAYRIKLEEEYEATKNNEIMNFFSIINPYIENYLAENSIDILLNNNSVIMSKDEMDITKKIINIINNEVK